MRIPISQLQGDLHQHGQEHLSKTRELFKLSKEVLNARPSDDEWTILECIEHLNLYCRFYDKEMAFRIEEAIKTKKKEVTGDYTFKSSWLGNYSAKSMLPDKNQKIRKMNTFSDKNPIHSALDNSVLEEFMEHQKYRLELLEKAKVINWNKTKCSLTLKFLKFNLGDTLRFVSNHETRHFLQIERIKAQVITPVLV